LTSPVYVAEFSFWAVQGEDPPFEVHLGIGAPYRIGEGEWGCPASLEGLQERAFVLRGMDSWQALQLANQFMRNLVGHFVENGGQLYWEKALQTPMSLESLWPTPSSA